MSMSSDSMYGSAIANLSLSEPRCNNDSCIAFYAAHNASQKATPWAHQFEYGHWTTWYYLVFVAIFSLIYLQQLARDYRAQHTSRPAVKDAATTWYQKTNGVVRSITYRRFSGPRSDGFGLPSFGMLVLLLAAILFLAVLTFAIRPYYRDHRGYGSPPLAVRTGLMAVACTPVIIALSGKANIITMLTGIGYEKLNVIHRWVSWMTLALSFVHTIPFIVAPLRDGGYAALNKQWYRPGASEYTGIAPFAMLVGIVLFSISPIRRRFYESFYFLHVLLGIAYVGTMFWHCGQAGDSWTYLWATIALWLASIMVRTFWYNCTFNVKNKWMLSYPASFISLPDGMTRVDIVPPEGFIWTPGQHCFLRIPTLSPFDNHPFTIASAPPASSGAFTTPVTFLIRPYTGFTLKLSSHASCNPDASLSTWLDGPYGGLNRPIEHTYNNVILVAGGSGISAVLPWLTTLSSYMKADTSLVNEVKLLWMVRRSVHVEWARTELKAALQKGLADRLTVTVFVTGPKDSDQGETLKTVVLVTNSDEGSGESEVGEIDKGEFALEGIAVCHYRPQIAEQLKGAIGAGKTMILACGPESLKVDVSNACAHEQSRVLRGEAQEVALSTETFGW